MIEKKKYEEIYNRSGIHEVGRLEFKAYNRRYDIRFNDYKILQLNGDSGSGKSLLYTDISKLLKFGNTNIKDKIKVVNYNNKEELEESIKNRSIGLYKYIIIDNADICINKAISKYIKNNVLYDNDTYWIIIGRNNYDCVPSHMCIAEIKHIDNGNEIIVIADYK